MITARAAWAGAVTKLVEVKELAALGPNAGVDDADDGGDNLTWDDGEDVGW